MKDLLRMLVLYSHLVACCAALGAAFIADLRLFRSRGYLTRADALLLGQVARMVTLALVFLWGSGALIVWLDFAHLPSWAELQSKPKLLTKLLTVSVLSINGVLLHKIALPRLLDGMPLARLPGREAMLICVIGSVSAVSWLFAAFLGVAKPLANMLSLSDFMLLHGVLLGVGTVGGLVFAGLVKGVWMPGGQAPAQMVESSRVALLE